MNTTHTPLPARIINDECEDANGNITLRVADGTPNGDTETCLATIYGVDFDFTEAVVNRYNYHDRLVEALRDSTDWLMSANESIRRTYGEGTTLYETLRTQEANNRALLAELEAGK